MEGRDEKKGWTGEGVEGTYRKRKGMEGKEGKE